MRRRFLLNALAVAAVCAAAALCALLGERAEDGEGYLPVRQRVSTGLYAEPFRCLGYDIPGPGGGTDCTLVIVAGDNSALGAAAYSFTLDGCEYTYPIDTSGGVLDIHVLPLASSTLGPKITLLDAGSNTLAEYL